MSNARRLATLSLAAFLCAATAPAVKASVPQPTSASSSYVVMLDSDADAVALARLDRMEGVLPSAYYRHAIKGFAATLTQAQVQRLRNDPSVMSVADDVEVSAAGTKGQPVPTQPESTPVGVRRIGAAGTGQADSAVAVLDTGLDLVNPDLNAAHGVNCVKASKPAQDDNGHGTHVGGTIAARANGADVVGVAPGTRLHAVKVLNSSAKGKLSSLLCGIDWVSANAQRLGIRVANVSITASGFDDGACGARNGDPLHAAICTSVAAGIVYVAAAGNAGADFAHSAPAAYSEVLTATAATDTDGKPGAAGGSACVPKEHDDHFGSYSNFATTAAAAAHTISAPGTCVASLEVGGGVATMLGTSMAAPHVAGAAALCLGTGGAPGPCAGSGRLGPTAVIAQLREDAASAAGDGFGFLGDPLEPLSGRHMGYLVSAAGY